MVGVDAVTSMLSCMSEWTRTNDRSTLGHTAVVAIFFGGEVIWMNANIIIEASLETPGILWSLLVHSSSSPKMNECMTGSFMYHEGAHR